MEYLKFAIGSLILLSLRPAGALAQNNSQGYLQLDPTYSQQLRYEAGTDQAVTPAKVLRWIMGLRGNVVSAPSPAEFQPIVNVKDSRVRIVAAIAYKF